MRKIFYSALSRRFDTSQHWEWKRERASLFNLSLYHTSLKVPSVSDGLSNFLVKPGNTRLIGTFMPFNGCMNVQYCLKHHVVVVHLVLKRCASGVTKTEFPYVLDENLWVDIFKLTFEMVIVWGSEISKKIMLWSEKNLST